MRRVAARPPAVAHRGRTVGQERVAAYPVVTAAPRRTPPVPPRADRRRDSARNWPRIWPRVAPRERRRPISGRRSSTEITIVLATPTPPTSRATPPRPSRSALRVALADRWAASASEGRDTSTSAGADGFAVAASTARTCSTDAFADRTYRRVGWPSKRRYVVAAGQP